ncbi:MAG: glycosyltransferase family 39 protein [Candidatus Methanoplasma sp.]|jgi:hypothetical protein|nr:glycosyltransferase family 39 protein [Candidatus Methanoplasma sp.]
MFDHSALRSAAGGFVRSPLFIVILTGVILRLVLFPLTEGSYDAEHWATVIKNIESGNGLYELEGYWYTPVWGYLLSFVSLVQDAFLNIDVLGMRVPEALVVESYGGNWIVSATVTSVAFNCAVKSLFLISDLLVGYILYKIIKEKTGDPKKATMGFALWFICPLVICSTSAQGMFDTFSVLFTLLCITFIRKDRLFLGGMMFTFAVLTKFFPAYLIFILAVYILIKHRDDGKGIRSLMIAGAGALLAFVVIMFPQILDGTLSESFLFLSSRTSIGGSTLFETLVPQITILFFTACVAVAVLLAYKMYKSRDCDPDDALFKYALMTIALLFLYPPLPQYLILLMPFLAIYIATKKRELWKGWFVLSVGATVFAVLGNLLFLLSFSTFTGIVSLDRLISLIEGFHSTTLFGVEIMTVLFYVLGALQYIGIMAVIWMIFKQPVSEFISRKKSGTHADDASLDDVAAR